MTVRSDETTLVFPSRKVMRTNHIISNFTVTCSKLSPPPDVVKLYAFAAVSSAHQSCIRCCMLCTTFLTKVFYSFSRTIPAFFISTSRSLVQSDLLKPSKNFLAIALKQYVQSRCLLEFVFRVGIVVWNVSHTIEKVRAVTDSFLWFFQVPNFHRHHLEM